MAQEVKIFVNTKEKVVDRDELCYAEVVALAGYAVPIPEGAVYEVTYSKGKSDQEGALTDGGKCVQPHTGMEFRVDPGNRS